MKNLLKKFWAMVLPKYAEEREKLFLAPESVVVVAVPKTASQRGKPDVW